MLVTRTVFFLRQLLRSPRIDFRGHYALFLFHVDLRARASSLGRVKIRPFLSFKIFNPLDIAFHQFDVNVYEKQETTLKTFQELSNATGRAYD